MSIATARRKAGKTQQELADEIGVTRSAVAQWEMVRGTRPDPTHAVALVKALPGLTLQQIYAIKRAA